MNGLLTWEIRVVSNTLHSNLFHCIFADGNYKNWFNEWSSVTHPKKNFNHFSFINLNEKWSESFSSKLIIIIMIFYSWSFQFGILRIFLQDPTRYSCTVIVLMHNFPLLWLLTWLRWLLTSKSLEIIETYLKWKEERKKNRFIIILLPHVKHW